MRVAFWRDGEGPSQRASHYRPMSPLPAGRPKRLSGFWMAYCHYRLTRSSDILAGQTMHRCCRGYG